MKQKEINIGIIGLGLMGREFASSILRWAHLLTDAPRPVLAGICDTNSDSWGWFTDAFPNLKVITKDYKELIASKEIDVIYCAVPHHLHEQLYIDILTAKKHLFGEKPFGIDQQANRNILKAIEENEELIVRCSSEFPYFPACQKMIQWIKNGEYGKLIEVKTGFHHSSDMDLSKPINWKRMVEFNGQYGCMGDLGLHTLHIPYHVGWRPVNVFADLQNIAQTRPDGKGNQIECKTWDNAVLTCQCVDPKDNEHFSMVVETKRMAPGATNNWFIEVYGTKGSARFSTHDPKAFYFLETKGKEQGWTRLDIGSQSAIPSITGGIFEFGFSDAFQQMVGAFLSEFSELGINHPFSNVTPQETAWSHKLFTAALKSKETGRCISIDYESGTEYKLK